MVEQLVWSEFPECLEALHTVAWDEAQERADQDWHAPHQPGKGPTKIVPPREWSGCSTELPEDELLEEEEDEDFNVDDCQESQGHQLAGTIKISVAKKATKSARFDDWMIPQEPMTNKCGSKEEESSDQNDQESSDQNYHIRSRSRRIVCDRKSHGRYFEDVKWNAFDPDFAQLLVQSSLEVIWEESADEEAEDAADKGSLGHSVYITTSYQNPKCCSLETIMPWV
eukprot:CAMPEP_0169080256 /NCGR_PEP_ID=MMETSP1015-20121227/10381_1 /TAXON_ID=342587 /ORGANISM="Karlodinium micrum, Strain CCMP2283" /LENGTH=225 /DNA_ID=CAMNT_0009139967 /DNA_START=73 /DNA_END=750 /DNA_ORIENTATION=-